MCSSPQQSQFNPWLWRIQFGWMVELGTDHINFTRLHWLVEMPVHQLAEYLEGLHDIAYHGLPTHIVLISSRSNFTLRCQVTCQLHRIPFEVTYMCSKTTLWAMRATEIPCGDHKMSAWAASSSTLEVMTWQSVPSTGQERVAKDKLGESGKNYVKCPKVVKNTLFIMQIAWAKMHFFVLFAIHYFI